MNSELKDKSCSYPLSQLYFYITDSCNLRCRHCWMEPAYVDANKALTALDPKLFAAIIDQALPMGLNHIKLTGGEPLLHPRIGELLAIAQDRRIGVSVETNATLCTPELAREIAACKEVSVAVSIDGMDGVTHDWIRGKEGCFHETLQGIENLVNAGIRPQVIMTIMRRNRDQIPAVIKLAETIGAGSVKFNIVQPTARGVLMHTRGETLTIEELIAIGTYVDQELALSTDLPLCFHHPPAFRGLAKMFGTNGDGCYRCGFLGILGVLANGDYALCGIGATVPELVFGNAARDSLSEVWLHNPVLAELRAGMPRQLKGICSTCVMQQVCLGSCIAQNYYSSHDLWAPFWYCEEAHRQGLFPETRLHPGGLS